MWKGFKLFLSFESPLRNRWKQRCKIHLCLHLFDKYLKRFNFANNFFCSLWRHGNFRKNAKQHGFIVWQQKMNKSLGFFDKKIFKLKCEVSSLTQTFFFQNCLWVVKVAKIVGIHICTLIWSTKMHRNPLKYISKSLIN